MKLRIWWISQVPMKSFYINIPEFEDDITQLKYAAWMLSTLAEYDKFQYENNVRPDYINVGGLEVWDVDLIQYENNVRPDYINVGGLEVWDVDLNSWCEWYNDNEIIFDSYTEVNDINDLIHYMYEIGEL